MKSFINDKNIISNNVLKCMYNSLKVMGYDKERYCDEIQAFLATGSSHEIVNILKISLDVNIFKYFKEYFNNFNKKI